MNVERELIQIRRRRGNMLKFIRQGHEGQFDRMDDFEMWQMMQDIGSNMSQRQVLTMLQDLQVLGYITFKQSFSQQKERMVAEEIMLTAVGLGITTRRRNNEEVLFD